ncbi:hypothetical protein DM02DRAFT_265365 [Periconia macrospinosa]|uniref:Uncharacterized protein n=1 Tax=Periconia macrospinosa TaxID=97972 RepID=A0A2V1DYV0_9PLEO|nr:hypothetical protein DM02DRAFT_265365 [Periconia macrospinosa]
MDLHDVLTYWIYIWLMEGGMRKWQERKRDEYLYLFYPPHLQHFPVAFFSILFLWGKVFFLFLFSFGSQRWWIFKVSLRGINILSWLLPFQHLSQRDRLWMGLDWDGGFLALETFEIWSFIYEKLHTYFIYLGNWGKKSFLGIWRTERVKKRCESEDSIPIYLIT